MVRELRRASASLREHGHDLAALDVEHALLEAAQRAGLVGELAGALAGHARA